MTDITSHLSAVSATEALKTTWDFMLKGGGFMIPLSITSIIGMMAILYKYLSLSRARVIPDALVRNVMEYEHLITQGRAESVLKQFQKGESTLARLCQVAVKHRDRPQLEIVHSVEAAAREEASHLHAGIGVLDIVITVAPLLGLLGTASGLVTIFQGLGNNSDQITIARGIAMALNTTIFGLTIAVPCVIAHGYFTRRIEVLSARLESLLADFARVCQKPAAKA